MGLFDDLELQDVVVKETVSFETGDKVTAIITSIDPVYSEKDAVLKKTPYGEDWYQHASFKDGLSYKAVALVRERGKEQKTIVEINKENESFEFPYGKFGFQFIFNASPQAFWGKDGSWDFTFPITTITEGDRINCPKQFHGLPPNWDTIAPGKRMSYWQWLASLFLRVGEKRPEYNYELSKVKVPVGKDSKGKDKFDEREIGKWILDEDTTHLLGIGDCFTAFISKSVKKDSPYPNYYLKGKIGYTSEKSDYDLFYIGEDKEKSVRMAKILNEEINKKVDKSNGKDKAKSKEPWDDQL